MLILLIALGVLSVTGVKFSKFHGDYSGKDQSTAIKGIFAVLILFSHMNSYLVPGGVLDSPYRRIISLIGQLMVTMFFFYSGYGIFKSFQKKTDYIQGFFRKRLLKVLLHFDVAVALFAVLNLILCMEQTKANWLLCWIGWGSIGNSNWFVFDTLIFYLITLATMLLTSRMTHKNYVFCAAVTLMSVLFGVILHKVRGTESWWYDTILCFPIGVWYGFLQDRIDKLAKKTVVWWSGLLLILVVFIGLYIQSRVVAYILCAAIFCLLVVWVTMKVKIQNRVLLWLGKQSFSIYIVQRLPMILFSALGWNTNKPVFVALTILIVFPLAAGFTWLTDQIDKKFFA